MNAMLKIGYYAWHDKVVGDIMSEIVGGGEGWGHPNFTVNFYISQSASTLHIPPPEFKFQLYTSPHIL